MSHQRVENRVVGDEHLEVCHIVGNLFRQRLFVRRSKSLEISSDSRAFAFDLLDFLSDWPRLAETRRGDFVHFLDRRPEDSFGGQQLRFLLSFEDRMRRVGSRTEDAPLGINLVFADLVRRHRFTGTIVGADLQVFRPA